MDNKDIMRKLKVMKKSLTYEELGRILHMPSSTIYFIINYGRIGKRSLKRLKKYIENMEDKNG